MRAVALQFSSSAIRAYTVDRDTQLVGANVSGQGLLTSDPSMTYTAGISTIPSDQNLETIFMIFPSGGFQMITPGVGFRAGDVIFFAPKAINTSAVIYFEP
jgi:hypothetical protein